MTKATELRELASLTTISSGQIQFDTDIKISGDLITTGNTITITADTLNISDPNITLASGSTNSSVANGAGITIDLGTDGSATLTYESNTDVFALNKHFKDGTLVDRTLNIVDKDYYTGNYPWRLQDKGGSFQIYYYNSPNMFTIKDNGNVGLGTDNPVAKLHIQGTNDTNGGIRIHNNGGNPYSIWSNQDKLFFSQGNGITTAIAIEYGGNVGIKNDNPTVMFEVGKLESGNTGLAIFNSEGGNEVGVKVQSRTNRATLQVADNDTSAFVQAEDGHAIYGQHSNLASADMTIDTDGNMNLQNGSYYVDQVRHAIRPTLNLDFANSKHLDSRITFYRDSIATYYDSKGVLRYANHNEPRFDHDPITGESKGLLVETARTNLVTGSEIPVTGTQSGVDGWFYAGGARVISKSALAPDGTFSAVGLVAMNADPYLFGGVNVVSGRDYTFSMWVKGDASNNYSTIGEETRLWWWDTQSIGGNFFPPALTTLTDEWQRIEVKMTAPGTGVIAPRFEHVDPATVGQIIHIWGVQVTEGTEVSSYIPSPVNFISRASKATYHDENGVLRTASANQPRYSHKWDGKRFVKTGLLIENQATHLSSGDNASFTNGGTGVSNEITTATKAPDGTYTARLITEDTSNGLHRITFPSWTPTAGTHYCQSIYLKGKGDTRRIYLNAGATIRASLTVDLEAGQIITHGATNVQASMEYVGDGWYRCSISGPGLANNNRLYLTIIRTTATGDDYYTGDGSSGCYAWGYQHEQGFSATSFIYSGSSTNVVTRAADVINRLTADRQADRATIEGDKLDFYNEDEGTLYVEAFSNKPTSDTGGGRIGFSYDSSNNDRWMMNFNSSSYAIYLQADGQTSVNMNNTAPGVGVVHKRAAAAKSNDAVAYIDGSKINEDVSVVMPKINIFKLSNPTTDGDFLDGCFKKVAYYPERLTNAQLQALTEND